MKKLMALTLLFVSVSAFAGTAYFVREIKTGGMTKQCVYEYLGDTYTRTISSASLCPLSIQV